MAKCFLAKMVARKKISEKNKMPNLIKATKEKKQK